MTDTSKTSEEIASAVRKHLRGCHGQSANGIARDLKLTSKQVDCALRNIGARSRKRGNGTVVWTLYR